jgi:hypothetical protein
MMGSQGIYYVPIVFKTEDQSETTYAIKEVPKVAQIMKVDLKYANSCLPLHGKKPFTGNRFETISIIWSLQILCIQLTTSSYDMQFVHSLYH